MAKSFSFTRNHSVVMITLLFVLLLGGLYIFKYIPYNQRNLEEKRYRSLRNIEDNVHAKIDNSVGMLNNLFNAYGKKEGEYQHAKLFTYIDRYPRQNFILSVDTNLAVSVPDTLRTITFNEDSLTISLSWKKVRFSLRYTISQFIDSLLLPDIYTGYLLMKPVPDGKKNLQKVIYQTFSSGVTTIDGDTLKTVKSTFGTDRVKSLTLSGNSYKIFSQEIRLKGTSVITIAGLLKDSVYENQKRKLPENAVLMLVVLATVAIISLPWIKLYQMGNQDRLTVADGIYSFLIAMLLMSLLFFLFLRTNKSLQNSSASSERIGTRLISQIDASFRGEIQRAYLALKGLDSLIKKDKPSYTYLGFDATALKLPQQKNDSLLKRGILLEDILCYTKNLRVKEIFWLKKNGDEAVNWSDAPEADIAPHGNFSHRSYFKAAANDRWYYMKPPEAQPFYLEQVISYTSGKFATVLSVPTDIADVPIVAMSLELQSLERPVLPAGFLYCIVDERGKVLYHSSPSRNLNENLYEEFSNTGELRSAIDTHGSAFFSTKYCDKEYYASVRPIANMPYQIVILEDKSFENTRNTNTFSFNFAMWFMFFLILMVQLLLVFIVSLKTSFFKKQYFDISWLGPHLAFHREYNMAVVWNILNIILLVFCYFFSSFMQFIFMLLISCSGLTLFINYSYAEIYRKTSAGKLQLKRRGNMALIVFIVMINISALLWVNMWMLVIFQGGVGLAAWLMISGKERIYVYGLQLHQKLGSFSWGFSNSFSMMIFTRLLITSGMPIFLFYIASYQFELKMTARYRQLQFTKSLIEKKFHPDNAVHFHNIFTDSTWINRPVVIRNKPVLQTSAEDANTAGLFSMLSAFNSKLPGTNELLSDTDNPYIFHNKLFDTDSVKSYHLLNDNTYMEISSGLLKYNMPVLSCHEHILELLRYLFFLVMLIVFAIVIHRIIRQLFALDLPSTSNWKIVDEVLLNDDSLNSLLFIIGAPGSGKLKSFKELIAKQPLPNGIFVADLILIPDTEALAATDKAWLALMNRALNHQHSIVIVNHFEYDIQNPATNRIKLNFMEALLQRNRSKVVIISTVHPVNFLDSLNQKVAGQPLNERQPIHDLQRWHVLLGHFRIVIHRLETKDLSFAKSSPAWEKILRSETQSGHFLKNMQDPVVKELKAKGKAPLNGDCLALKMQITSHYFYMYLWQSLTKEEKFLLYDLAEDGLVNPYDDYNLTLLISKGLIIVKGGKLRLFNKGFRNFILTAIGSTEAMEIRKQITDNGNWKSLKTPLLILIAAVIVFLFASQQEAYATVIKYLGIVSVAVPGVLKLMSMFNTDSSTKS